MKFALYEVPEALKITYEFWDNPNFMVREEFSADYPA